jgi:hypothetical protein
MVESVLTAIDLAGLRTTERSRREVQPDAISPDRIPSRRSRTAHLHR